MITGIKRRTIIKSAAIPLVMCSGIGTLAAPTGVFAHGVASGDPASESTVLWTRVTVSETRPTVRWELATDASFDNIVQRGDVHTDASRDFTVKVLVTGLDAGGHYFYRFRCAGAISLVGRARTLPVGSLQRLGIAVVSCSNYPFGYFNAYGEVANDRAVDYVLHLGDYLYEYAADSWGGDVGARLGRQHQPPHETVSLQDYRARHAQYKADPQSIAMHAAHPLLVIWDDHETANNPWVGGAENHQPDLEGDWQMRRAAALQAWYEWMPVRDPDDIADRARYWRHFEFGDLASLVTLETRHTGRSEQVDYRAYADRLSDPAALDDFKRSVLGDPSRQMPSAEQEMFFADAMVRSIERGRPWRLLGNQVPMARTNNPVFSDEALVRIQQDASPDEYARAVRMSAMGKAGLPLYTDPWDGYPAARERLYDLCRQAGVNDLLVVTGDSHSFWQNQLFDGQGDSVGLELGTTGVTSPGDFMPFGEWGAAEADRQIVSANPEIVWTDCRYNGYVRLVLEPERAFADFVAVSTVQSRQFSSAVIRHVAMVHADGALRYSGLKPTDADLAALARR